ncbi:MAG: UPF0149 family protein [Gammaproteobacteria bacterium]
MTYTELNTLFRRFGGAQNTAEAHGIATAMLCVDMRCDAATWLREVLRDAEALEIETRAPLLLLFESTRRLLQDEDFEFDLMLPDEDTSLQQRAEALRDWCHGFLFGIGHSRSNGEWPGECRELIQDIVEISRLDASAEGEEDENALTQIHEFLRTAVLLIQQEFNNPRVYQTQH